MYIPFAEILICSVCFNQRIHSCIRCSDDIRCFVKTMISMQVFKNRKSFRNLSDPDILQCLSPRNRTLYQTCAIPATMRDHWKTLFAAHLVEYHTIESHWCFFFVLICVFFEEDRGKKKTKHIVAYARMRTAKLSLLDGTRLKNVSNALRSNVWNIATI